MAEMSDANISTSIDDAMATIRILKDVMARRAEQTQTDRDIEIFGQLMKAMKALNAASDALTNDDCLYDNKGMLK